MNLLEKEDLIKVKAEELENASPEEIIRWAVETFPNITFACSFGAEDVVLVDMLQKVSPSTDVFIWIRIIISKKPMRQEILWLINMEWSSCVCRRRYLRRNKHFNTVMRYGVSILTNAVRSAR